MEELIKFEDGLYQINLQPVETVERTSGYLIQDEKVVIIETGASASNSVILKALEELKIPREKVDAIIVTHIHLDHAGGAGLLMEQCPNATLLVHPNGADHMIDTSKIEAGARQVYGHAFEHYFAPLKDTPAERVQVMQDGDEYQIGSNRKLTFYNAEGHARHHFMILDSLSQALFTGDAAGMTYPTLKAKYNVDLCLPASTPTQFDPDAMMACMEKIRSLKPQWVYFTHFGGLHDVDFLIEEMELWLKVYKKDAVKFYKEHHRLDMLKNFLVEKVLDELEGRDVPRDNETLEKLQFDMDLNAQGIIAYIKRMEKNKQKKKHK